MQKNTLELFIGENVCTLGCKHCPHNIKKSSETSKSGLNNEQVDIILKTQSVLTKQTGENGVMLFNRISNSDFELPFEIGFHLDYFLANLGNVETEIEASKFSHDNYFNQYTTRIIDSVNKVISGYMGQETVVRYGVTLEKNIFDPKLTSNADLERLVNMFFYLYLQHTMGYIEKSDEKIIEFVFGSNNIDTGYFDDSLPRNYGLFNTFIESLLESMEAIIGYISLQDDYGILKLSKNDGSIFFSRDDLSIKSSEEFSRSRFSYRVLPDKFSSRDTNIVHTSGNNLISIHPDSVQLQHHSHNINNKKLWFEFSEYKALIEEWEKSKSSNSFYEICMKELERRGVVIKE